MKNLKEHLEKSREKLEHPGVGINSKIVGYLADIHIALETRFQLAYVYRIKCPSSV